jgi:hypothetical protein
MKITIAVNRNGDSTHVAKIKIHDNVEIIHGDADTDALGLAIIWLQEHGHLDNPVQLCVNM